MKNTGLITAIITLFVLTNAFAQEYKIKVSGSKTLNIKDVNKVNVEGYEGSEIIFTTVEKRSSRSERAEGLTAIGAMGLEDNTGIGLSVKESGEVIEVQPMSKRSGGRYLIKVPSNVKIYYEHSSNYGSKFNVSNISSEIEISTNYNSINLENVTGPMTINTVHGKVEVVFSTVNQSNPISIVSIHGLIDVSLPANTKANIRMSSGWGEIYTDLDINFDQTANEMRSKSTKVSGKLNGGGVTIDLSTSHNNIYLREKK